MPVSPRVVSLVPSATETLIGWGVTPVACTRFCEQPAIQTVGGTKNPDVEAIVALAPDLVVTEQDENRKADYDLMVTAGLEVLALSVTSVDGLVDQMANLAAAVGQRADKARACEPEAPALAELGLTAFVPIWRRPYMTLSSDTYGASLLGRLGVASAYDTHSDRFPVVAEAELAELTERRSGVDVVLAPTEPYPFTQRHLAELAQFAPTMLIDGADLFWWGWRTPTAQRRLERALERLPFAT